MFLGLRFFPLFSSFCFVVSAAFSCKIFVHLLQSFLFPLPFSLSVILLSLL
jgi:hypothetical protein